jgi:hypothetical protein
MVRLHGKPALVAWCGLFLVSGGSNYNRFLRRPDQRVDAVGQGGAVRRCWQVGMLQLGRFVAQHVARRPFADRLHLVEPHIVESVLQRQKLGNAAASSERESGAKT